MAAVECVVGALCATNESKTTQSIGQTKARIDYLDARYFMNQVATMTQALYVSSTLRSAAGGRVPENSTTSTSTAE
jgi:hypothetical protein